MEIGALLDALIKADVPIEYVLQKPGQLVSSPPGVGAAHLVYADGKFNPSGILLCLEHVVCIKYIWPRYVHILRMI